MRMTGLEPAPPKMGQESESYILHYIHTLKLLIFFEKSTFFKNMYLLQNYTKSFKIS